MQIAMDKNKVRDRAISMIDQIKEERASILEQEIDKLMSKRFFKPKSREAAEAKLKKKAAASGGFIPWLHKYNKQEESLHLIIKACNQSDYDTVTLNKDDVEDLGF